MQLEIEKTRLACQKLLSGRRSGSASSGLHTPRSGFHSPIKSERRSGTASSGSHTPRPGFHTPSKSDRSASYYFNQLKEHFNANNSLDRYCITHASGLCKIFDGKEIIHQVDVNPSDSTSIRNLYLMFYASDYKVETFKQKRDAREFESFDGTTTTSPPQFNADKLML